MGWRALPGWTSDIESFYPWLAQRIPRDGVFVEVGVFLGRSIALMHSLRPDLDIYGVDIWEADYRHIKHGCDLVSLGGLPEDADVLQRMPFYDAFQFLMRKHAPYAFERINWLRMQYPQAMHPLADAVFVDADHTYEAGMADLTHAKSRLKSTGLLTGHDHEYRINNVRDPKFNPNPLFPDLVRAIDEFAASNNKRVIVGVGHPTEWSTSWRMEDK
jgi:hypothetical protein